MEEEKYIVKKNVYVELKNGVKAAECWINCFDRMLTVLFKDVSNEEICIIEDLMEMNYFRWHDGDSDMGCEEYILEELTGCYQDKIVAIIYDNDEEEEE